MSHIALGILLGLAAGVIVVALMMPMSFPDKRAALTAAFVSRFSIGFLTANTLLPIHPVATGAVIGLMLSIPDALSPRSTFRSWLSELFSARYAAERFGFGAECTWRPTEQILNS